MSPRARGTWLGLMALYCALVLIVGALYFVLYCIVLDDGQCWFNASIHLSHDVGSRLSAQYKTKNTKLGREQRTVAYKLFTNDT